MVKDIDKDKHARDFVQAAVGSSKEHSRAAEWTDDGLKVIIMSSGGRHFCAYLGIPLDHPLAGFDYDSLPIDCHGGLTFAGEGDGVLRTKGYYWYGWDYAHLGDFSHYGFEGAREKQSDEQDWTLGEVEGDIWTAIYEMKNLRKLAEAIYANGKGE